MIRTRLLSAVLSIFILLSVYTVAYCAETNGEEYATTSAAGIVLTDGGVYKLVYETF